MDASDQCRSSSTTTTGSPARCVSSNLRKSSKSVLVLMDCPAALAVAIGSDGENASRKHPGRAILRSFSSRSVGRPGSPRRVRQRGPSANSKHVPVSTPAPSAGCEFRHDPALANARLTDDEDSRSLAWRAARSNAARMSASSPCLPTNTGLEIRPATLTLCAARGRMNTVDYAAGWHQDRRRRSLAHPVSMPGGSDAPRSRCRRRVVASLTS